MKQHILKRKLLLIMAFMLILSLFGGCDIKSVDLPQSASSAASPYSSSEAAPVSADSTVTQSVTVYVTETGTKYHCKGCSYLANSCIPIDLESAKRSYGPCSKCNPPT